MSDPVPPHDSVRLPEPERRRFLAGLAALPLAAAVAQTSRTARASSVRSSARIVIAGGGAAGLTMAAQFANQLQGASITVIDGRKAHLYQPGFTLVAAGIKPVGYVNSTTQEHLVRGVQWVPEYLSEIDPDGKKVVTASGKSIPYDYLIVATGCELNYAGIEGMDETRIGQNGLGSIYHSPQAAYATWQAMSAFADQGGVALHGRPATGMKCAGAPIKYALLNEDLTHRRGTRDKTEFVYMGHNPDVFAVPIINEVLLSLFRQRGVKFNPSHVLKAIDLDRRIASYSLPDGGTMEHDYDFINVVPPMRAHAVVRNSALTWGDRAAGGWLEVDPHTLRHDHYPNVFGVGDVCNVRRGKTAATVKWMAPVAASHVLGDITGKPSTASFNGYTSCPLITRYGRAMLLEFGYTDDLILSFPGFIDPLAELWVSWVIKTVAVQPIYFAMLRGRA